MLLRTGVRCLARSPVVQWYWTPLLRGTSSPATTHRRRPTRHAPKPLPPPPAEAVVEPAAQRPTSPSPFFFTSYPHAYKAASHRHGTESKEGDEPRRPAAPSPLMGDAWITPFRVQQRIRSMMVQLVLRSSAPLTPVQLYHQVEQHVDDTTRYMCDWAQHAMYLYVREKHPVGETEEEGNASEDDPSEGSAENERTRVEYERRGLRRLGMTFTKMYKEGVLQLVFPFDLHASGSRRHSLADSADQACSSAPVDMDVQAYNVLQWMVHGILLSDPYFRISSYSAAVLYPSPPSLLTATWSVNRDGRYHQRAFQILHAERSVGLEPLQESPAEGQQTPAHTDEDNRALCMGSTRTFVWLSETGSVKRPAIKDPAQADSLVGHWTAAHSLFYLFDAFIDGSDGISRSDIPPLPRSQISGAALATARSGHPLIDHWVNHHDPNAFDTMGTGVEGHPSVDGAGALANPWKRLRHLTGWNEGQSGSDALQSWVSDATSGYIASIMRDVVDHRSGITSVTRVNTRVLSGLFRYVICVPISVARLSVLTRWNMSLPFASAYGSLLHFLVLFAGNVTTARAQQREHEQRVVKSRLAEFAFRGKSDGTQHSIRRTEESVRRHWGRSLPGEPTTLVYGSQKALAVEEAKVAAADGNSTSVTNSTETAPLPILERTSSVMALRHLLQEGSRLAQVRGRQQSLVQLLFFRVRSGRRLSPPGTGLSNDDRGGAGHLRPAAFQHVDVVDTRCHTPREVMALLASAEGHTTGTEEVDGSFVHTDEERILCFPISSFVIDRRIKAVAQAWQQLSDATSPHGSGVHRREVRPLRVSVAHLCRLCLWEHEYGLDIASEMMFATLSSSPSHVTLDVPTGGDQATTPVAEWVATFL